jgi:hypothetical protein
MSVARDGASSAVLSDGRVLVSGGNDAAGNPQASVEYLGSGSSAGTMTMARSGHISVVLNDGTILLAGGHTTAGAVTNSAEIFNPADGISTAISSLLVARANATASLLSDGRVLIAGGQGSGSPLQTMEIFDPASGQFSNAAPLSVARQNHAAAVLLDGRVLIAGGSDGANPLASVEVYDPAANTVSALPAMSTARAGLSATTLLKGNVLLAGGGSAATEIFDPATGASAPGPSMSAARTGHLALLLPNNNTVLMVSGSAAAAAEVFVPWANNGLGAFAAFGTLANPRTGAAGGASGQSGIASVAGGQVSGAASNAVEAVQFPMVKTDKEDYQPGDTAIITGSGFQYGETVNLSIEEIPDLDADSPIPLQTTADANGHFTISFPIDEADLNIRFYLSATGATSGLTAGKTFTDAINLDTTTTLNAITTPLTAGQAGVNFSGLVDSTTIVPNTANHVTLVRRTTCASGPTIDIVTVSFAGTSGSTARTFSGSFTAPAAGTYGFFCEVCCRQCRWRRWNQLESVRLLGRLPDHHGKCRRGA